MESSEMPEDPMRRYVWNTFSSGPWGKEGIRHRDKPWCPQMADDPSNCRAGSHPGVFMLGSSFCWPGQMTVFWGASRGGNSRADKTKRKSLLGSKTAASLWLPTPGPSSVSAFPDSTSFPCCAGLEASTDWFWWKCLA